ncbi:hypothetical protein OB985_04135 [Bacillus cereus]|nr:hypothetical protein [Bacillus cereus]
MDYRLIGLETYGHRCEICGHSLVEVHHIDYQEQQALEIQIRKAIKAGKDTTELLETAKEQGYEEWDGNQLSKNNQSTNLSVLCGNCHCLIHRLDAGKKLLKVLERRR